MKTKPNELRELNVDELQDKFAAGKKELFDLRMAAAAGKLEKTHRLLIVRRDVARLATLLKEHRKGVPPQ